METYGKDEEQWEECQFEANVQRLDFTNSDNVKSVLSKVEEKVNLQHLEEWYVVSRAELFSVRVCTRVEAKLI
jgi:hypothetical protein